MLEGALWGAIIGGVVGLIVWVAKKLVGVKPSDRDK